MTKVPEQSVQAPPESTFYHLFWPSLPPESLQLTPLIRITPLMSKINVEVMLLETWTIPNNGTDGQLYFLHVADRTGSCFVKTWDRDVIQLVPGDIIRILSASPQLFAGKLTLKHSQGSKIERIGTTALPFTEDPNISLFTWTNDQGEELFTNSKQKSMNFNHSTKLLVDKSQSLTSLNDNQIPPSQRALKAKSIADDIERRRADLLHGDSASAASQRQTRPLPSKRP